MPISAAIGSTGVAFAVFVDVVVVVLLLYRQRQVRRVRTRINLRLAGVLALFGLIELIDFSSDHHLSGRVLGILVLSLLISAGALGAVRAAAVRI